MEHSFDISPASIARWTGRIFATLLFLFWGSFFVEHLAEWFLRGGGQYPPVRVWIAQALHFAMLVGLALLWRWERIGTVVLLAATVAFFSIIGLRTFPWIALLNVIPVLCFTLSWVLPGRPRPA
jgi:hypothetical protein